MFFNRQQLAELEAKILAPYAVKSRESQGREFKEVEEKERLPFQKDRDRIIHCRSFRRLKAKTQVFISHYGDHYRTRLTHTLEVAQISRDGARSLGLNEDLAEAIALAHDLGHTPFGHAGEEALDQMMQKFGLRFEHNEQSRRVVEFLEDSYPDFRGLNLTYEVREGLIKHQSSWDKQSLIRSETAACEFRSSPPPAPSLEAQVVNLADEIAYNNHDVDDGLRAGILQWEDLKKINLWEKALEKAQEQYGPKTPRRILKGRVISQTIHLMIRDLYRQTERNLRKFKIRRLKDVYHCPKQIVDFSPQMKKWNQELKNFLTQNLYLKAEVLRNAEKGQKIIRELFEKYFEKPEFLPSKIQRSITPQNPKEIVIKDYIAGMTDRFAEEEWRK